jgi:hypothetical protein
VDLDFDETGLDADEDRPRSSSEHLIVLAEEAGGTVEGERASWL